MHTWTNVPGFVSYQFSGFVKYQFPGIIRKRLVGESNTGVIQLIDWAFGRLITYVYNI